MLPVGLADFMEGTLLRIVRPVNGILHGFVRDIDSALAGTKAMGRRNLT
jgi:hypothetical protein